MAWTVFGVFLVIVNSITIWYKIKNEKKETDPVRKVTSKNVFYFSIAGIVAGILCIIKGIEG